MRKNEMVSEKLIVKFMKGTKTTDLKLVDIDTEEKLNMYAKLMLDKYKMINRTDFGDAVWKKKELKKIWSNMEYLRILWKESFALRVV